MSEKFVHKGDEKKKYVKQMFNDISIHYDRLNLLSSFGIDRYWRNMLVKEMPLSSHDVLLDVATGTGDVALAFYVKYKVNVVGVDIADKMIDIANQKAQKYKTSKLIFSIEDAESMSFDDNKFSALTISFGFRNMGFYDKALSEFYRVIQNKGKIGILEFSNPKSKWFGNEAYLKSAAGAEGAEAFKQGMSLIKNAADTSDLHGRMMRGPIQDASERSMELGIGIEGRPDWDTFDTRANQNFVDVKDAMEAMGGLGYSDPDEYLGDMSWDLEPPGGYLPTEGLMPGDLEPPGGYLDVSDTLPSRQPKGYPLPIGAILGSLFQEDEPVGGYPGQDLSFLEEEEEIIPNIADLRYFDQFQ